MPGSLIYPSSTPAYFHNMHSLVNNNVREEDHGYYLNSADVISYPMVSSTLISNNNPYFNEPMIPDYDYTLDLHNNMDIVTENISHYLKDPILNADTCPVASLDHTKRSPEIMVAVGTVPAALVLPNDAMEIDNELGVFHLLMAYTEAVEMKHDELAKVIIKRISEKVSLLGDTVECLMYHMFQTMDNCKQSDYLKQESIKNFYTAFKAFYQIFPYGKFAHFSANSAILEALPDDVEVLRVFDFDIGEGIQWASLIESIGNKGVQVLLTSVKFNDVADSNTWRFEETKKRLSDYSRLYGFKLKVEEIDLYDLQVDLKNYIKTKYGIISKKREFFVFNCMSCLPHMGRIRSQKEITGFLRTANDFLKTPDVYDRNGIIISGDGNMIENRKNIIITYSDFLNVKMTRYQALLESMKMNFPLHLAEARTSMECLFVAPFVSCNVWGKEWEDGKSGHHLPELRLGLDGLKISQKNLIQAKRVVKEGECGFGVRIESERNNKIVMDWRGISLISVSCWRS